MPSLQVLSPQTRYYEKDTVGTPITTGHIYDNGPWSLCVNEVISEVVQGGSPLMQWIPSRGSVARNEHVAHLGFVVPDGFDGSETYMDYLAGLDAIGECEFGPTTDWNAFEYRHEMYRISFKSDTLTRRNFGMRECDQQPIYRMRGPNAGLSLANDGEWAMGRTGLQLESHLNWNVIYGDPSAGQLMYHGLDNVIDTGFVASRAIGPGQVTFADPFIQSAVGVTDVGDLLRMIRAAVRRIRTRAFQRGYRLTPNDYAIVMSGTHWSSLLDVMACGGVLACSDNVVLNTTPEVVQRQREQFASGGLGYGVFPVDGVNVPVIIEDQLAANVTLTDGSPGVTGDIYVLTRYFNGQTILENQYLDWNQLQVPFNNPQEFTRQNGMLRVGWVTEANSCFYYYVDMWGRLISRYQPLQAKITDVTLSTLMENENESVSFTSQDFYAYGGQRGGAGVALINGIS